jgi:hypothetical protein
MSEGNFDDLVADAVIAQVLCLNTNFLLWSDESSSIAPGSTQSILQPSMWCESCSSGAGSLQ